MEEDGWPRSRESIDLAVDDAVEYLTAAESIAYSRQYGSLVTRDAGNRAARLRVLEARRCIGEPPARRSSATASTCAGMRCPLHCAEQRVRACRSSAARLEIGERAPPGSASRAPVGMGREPVDQRDECVVRATERCLHRLPQPADRSEVWQELCARRGQAFLRDCRAGRADERISPLVEESLDDRLSRSARQPSERVPSRGRPRSAGGREGQVTVHQQATAASRSVSARTESGPATASAPARSCDTARSPSSLRAGACPDERHRSRLTLRSATRPRRSHLKNAPRGITSRKHRRPWTDASLRQRADVSHLIETRDRRRLPERTPIAER